MIAFQSFQAVLLLPLIINSFASLSMIPIPQSKCNAELEGFTQSYPYTMWSCMYDGLAEFRCRSGLKLDDKSDSSSTIKIQSPGYHCYLKTKRNDTLLHHVARYSNFTLNMAHMVGAIKDMSDIVLKCTNTIGSSKSKFEYNFNPAHWNPNADITTLNLDPFGNYTCEKLFTDKVDSAENVDEDNSTTSDPDDSVTEESYTENSKYQGEFVRIEGKSDASTTSAGDEIPSTENSEYPVHIAIANDSVYHLNPHGRPFF